MSEVSNRLGRTRSGTSIHDSESIEIAGPRSARALRRWLAEEGAALVVGLSAAEQAELSALAEETDAELAGRGLLRLAGRWEQSEKFPQSLALYQFLATPALGGDEISAEVRRCAHTRLQAIQGQGGFGSRAEFLLRRFAREASDPRMIVPMLLGSAAYGLTRTAALGRLLGAAKCNLLTRGWGARLAAGVLGYAAEVPTFALSGRVLRRIGSSQDHSEPGLGAELAGAALTLGVLKLTGGGSQAALHRAGISPQSAAGILFSQGSQFLGLLGAHRAEMSLGLRPGASGAALATDALASMLSMGVGAQLGRKLLGGRMDRLQTELELRARTADSYIPEGRSGAPSPLVPALAAGAVPFPSRLARPRVHDAFGEKLGPPQPLMMEDLKWREFQKEFVKVRANPTALSPQVRKTLTQLAEQTTRESGHYKRQPEYQAALALRDFTKLRALAKHLMSRLPKSVAEQVRYSDKDKWEDLLLAHLVVEDYDAVFKLMNHPIVATFGRDEGDASEYGGTVVASIPVREAYALDYAARKGFDRVYTFDLVATLRDLVSLAQQYDVFLGIARGGLYSASVADLLGFPNIILEVHAHGRRKATSRWVDSVHPDQIAGKRVLLLDKDAVTGATIAETLRLLRPMRPAQVGVYFNHGPEDGKQAAWERPSGGYELGPRMSMAPARSTARVLPPKTAQRIRAAGVAIHYPGVIAEVPMEPAFHAAHLHLKTPLGRMAQVAALFEGDLLPVAREADAPTAEALARQWEAVLRQQASLNPLVPGVRQIREGIVSFLDTTVRDFYGLMRAGLRDPTDKASYAHLTGMLASEQIQEQMAEEFARARYWPWASSLAQARGIELLHVPHSYISAFRAAQEAVSSVGYQVALIVGPEGFAYEPMFRDLGVPTLAVNIPEADFAGKRTLKKLEPLESLKGKRVLVVEDDVRSGATLERLLRGIRHYGPFAELGLFLGLPHSRQMKESIPKAFQKIFISDPLGEKDHAAFMGHFSEREEFLVEPERR